MAKLYIHAVNIHNGGGKNLLYALLAAIPSSCIVNAALDSRLMSLFQVNKEINITFIAPTIWERLKSEWTINKKNGPHDVLLFFGNLPPLFKSRAYTVVFVQNRYLIDNVDLYEFPLWTNLRLRLERLWFRYRINNVDEFLVQTPTMKKLLEVRTNGNIPIYVLPFMTKNIGYERKLRLPEIKRETKDFDFLYVASGEPHKNHKRLIESWCLLAKEGLFPSLKLTIDIEHFADLCSWIEERVVQYQMDVENLGGIPSDQMNGVYMRAGALIYPSTFESFGLPLIEARQTGLPVLASELDYVRDVLDPEQTFDARSAISIARAVKRFLGLEEAPLPLDDAEGFLAHLLGVKK